MEARWARPSKQEAEPGRFGCVGRWACASKGRVSAPCGDRVDLFGFIVVPVSLPDGSTCVPDHCPAPDPTGTGF